MEKNIEDELIISKIYQETPLVKTFEIRRKDGLTLPEFSAGSHIRIKTPNGMVRKYSLTNSIEDVGKYLISVKREEKGRGGSISLWDDAKQGDSVEVTNPINSFELVEKAKSYIFIAGGIGITPLLSMIRSMGEMPYAPWKLYYLTANKESTPFYDELISGQYPGKVVIHHTEGKPGNRFDLWPVLEKENTAHVYCCGSHGLMEDVRDMSGHWSPSNIHFESFDDAAAIKPDDTPFIVKCAKSKIEVEVPLGKTILAVLQEKGIEIPYSCESGTCGTCKTDLISGEVDHRDFVLLPEEQSHKVMVCVSRAKSAAIEIDV